MFARGRSAKMWPRFTTEWEIPFILLGIAIVITIPYIAVVQGEGWSAAVMIVAFIQAVLIAGMAVFGNELIKQITNKRKVDTKL